MGEPFRNLVDGKWVQPVSGTTFDDLNPANRADVLGRLPRSDHRDADRAVEAARAHFGTWSRIPARRRGEILRRAARIVEDCGQELTALLVRETGKVAGEAEAEWRDGVSLLYTVAAETEGLGGILSPPDTAGAMATSVPAPLGVAAAITHWTFGLAGSIASLATVLAAGNTVVFKPAADAGLVGTRLAEILLDAGVPPGACSLVHGYGEEVAAPLVRHPDVAVVSFAGSPEVGREIAITCAAERKRLLADLGRRFVVVVLEDADLDFAVEGTVRSAFAMAGQRWRGAARAVVLRKAAKEFTERLVARVQSLRVGDGADAATDVGPVIGDGQLKRVHAHTRTGVREGAKLLCGGEAIKDGECKRGFFYAPTVFADATLKMRLLQDDVLGPTMVLLQAANHEEAMEQANAVGPAATTVVYTCDLGKAFRVVEHLRAECIRVNPPLDRGDAGLALAGYDALTPFGVDAVRRRLQSFAGRKDVGVYSLGGR
jgi:aldehyde dehydrogenase (NAD+)